MVGLFIFLDINFCLYLIFADHNLSSTSTSVFAALEQDGSNYHGNIKITTPNNL